MDDFVMGERQDEVLGERIKKTKGQLVVVIVAVDRVFAEVFERVMHPSHVPLHRETKTAGPGGPRHLGPGGRFFCHDEAAGALLMGDRIELFKESDGLEIFVTAIFVGDPVAGLPRIVEIEHGGDRIDPKAIEVEFLKPKKRAADQEVADFVATIVIDQGAPVAMLAEPWILMLIERGSIEGGEAMGIFWEVGRHPVQNDAHPMLMAIVDEPAKIIGASEAAGGCEIPGGLITPGPVKGVLGDRQQFKMGKSKGLDVGDQVFGQRSVIEEAPLGVLPPRAEMDLIDRHRLTEPVSFGSGLCPCLVLPVVMVGRDGDGGRSGPQFKALPVRVRL